jgi:hypothetical protein
MLKKPPAHPSVDDLNNIYGPRNVGKLAQAHGRLAKRFQVGDHIEHIRGIAAEDVRVWRVHMRSLPQLARTLLRDAINFSLSATPPLPIEWVIKRRGATGWAVSVTQGKGGLIVAVTPPAMPEPAPKAKPGAK